MAQGNDVVGTAGGDVDESIEASGEVVAEEGQTPRSQQENESNEADAMDEELDEDWFVDEGDLAEDAAAAVAPTPPKRKSHRPSLEVVQVKVESFYDKGSFKQELQVRRTGCGHFTYIVYSSINTFLLLYFRQVLMVAMIRVQLFHPQQSSTSNLTYKKI